MELKKQRLLLNDKYVENYYKRAQVGKDYALMAR